MRNEERAAMRASEQEETTAVLELPDTEEKEFKFKSIFTGGENGSKKNPICKLSRFICRSMKEEGITILLDRQIHLGQKIVSGFLCSQRAQINLDFDPVGRSVFNQNLLREGVTGHHVLEVGEQVRGRILAAGSKNEFVGISVIGNGAGCIGSYAHAHRHKKAKKNQTKSFHSYAPLAAAQASCAVSTPYPQPTA